jgi:superfamily II DNA or RNA helicase
VADVLKALSETILETGHLYLTPGDQRRLELPVSSGTTWLISIEGKVSVDWDHKARVLSGDDLTEFLQLFGSVRSSVRLSRHGQTIEISIVEQLNTLASFRAPGPTAETISSSENQLAGMPPEIEISTARAIRNTTSNRFRVQSKDEFTWSGSIGVNKRAWESLDNAVANLNWSNGLLPELRAQGERLSAIENFADLMSLDMVNVQHMPHQEATVRRVLGTMNGRAVLADEVGLGKTIEAGLIIKELVLRSLVKRVLILTPTTLREQWRGELEEKFGEEFRVVTGAKDGFSGDRLIMSTTLAKRNLATLTKLGWELVVVDEAHKEIRASGTHDLHRAFAKSRYLLMLTATPVQNDLYDLYHLVEAVRPGTFSNKAAFKSMFMYQGDERRPKRPEDLRNFVRHVIARTTREQAGVDSVKRITKDYPVTLSDDEKRLYDLCLDAVRTSMSGPHDTVRRQTLARRLTASPYALAITSTRMADTTSGRTREALLSIARAADAIKRSNRQQLASDITKEWVKEHGRVLVFAQHTDTVVSLLRLFEEEGLRAKSFHGRMTDAARRVAVNAFRAHDIQVLVSSDAGAEGQNLQFCNTILNYDLPWNPMKIEQRIGRVHRLTQTRDVRVGNIFAKDTLDEGVYRVLHDKLRMFELLFGQITYVLGEFDERNDKNDKSAKNENTFESRILAAVLSSSNREMDKKLGLLGDLAETAAERARNEISDATQVSSWLATGTTHRADIPVGGARELMPAQAAKVSTRRGEVAQWACDYLKFLGASVVGSETDENGELQLASFDIFGAPAERLGGTQIHLAFTPQARSLHPHAELCAAGSPVFDELLDDARQSMAVSFEFPHLPTLKATSPLTSINGFVFRSRSIEYSGELSVACSSKLSRDDGSDEQVVKSGANLDLGDVQSLLPGEAPPSAYGTIKDLRRAAKSALDSLIDVEFKRMETVAEARFEAYRVERAQYWQRRTSATEEELSTARYGDVDELTDELRKIRQAAAKEMGSLQATTHQPVRFEPVALRFVGPRSFRVIEEWTDPKGRVKSIRYPWPGNEPTSVHSQTGRQRVQSLVICDDGHFVDSTEARRCPRCAEYRCDLCEDSGRLPACAICNTPACKRCRSEFESICNTCAQPDRRPDLDTTTTIGWSYPTGATLHVGKTSAWHVTDETTKHLLHADLLQDIAQRRLSGVAASLGVLEELNAELVEAKVSPQTDFCSNTAVSHEWSIQLSSEARFDIEVARLLPKFETPPKATIDSSVHQLLNRLRDTHQFSNCLTLVCREVADTSTILVDGTGITLKTERTIGNEVAHPLSSVSAEWVETPTGLTAVVGNVTATAIRLNQGFLVEVRGLGPAIKRLYSGRVDGGYEIEASLVDLAQREGAPLPTGADKAALFQVPEPSSPSEATLIERVVRPRFSFHSVVSQDLVEPQLQALTDWLPPSTSEVDAVVSTSLADQRRAAFQSETRLKWEVTERWRGFGEAEFTIELRNEQPHHRPMENMRVWSDDFGVCSDGHLYEATTSVQCGLCAIVSCAGCDEQHRLSKCHGCREPACGSCRTDSPRSFAVRSCVICASSDCHSCGRTRKWTTCACCSRLACDACTVNLICSTCQHLQPLSPGDSRIPKWLRVSTETVLFGSDSSGSIFAVNGNIRRELVLWNKGGGTVWWADPENLSQTAIIRTKFLATADRSLDAELALQQLPIETNERKGIGVYTSKQQAIKWLDGNGAPIEYTIDGSEPVDNGAFERILNELGDATPDPLPGRTPHPNPDLLQSILKPTTDRLLVKVDSYLHVEELVLTEAGITKHQTGSEPELVAWSPSYHHRGSVGTVIASCSAGPVTACLERLNTVAIVVVETPAGKSFYDVGTNQHHAVHAAFEQAHLTPSMMLDFSPQIPDVAQTSEASLVTRTVTRSLSPTSSHDALVRPLDEQDLAAMGITASAEITSVHPTGLMVDKLPPFARVSLAPMQTLATQLHIHETWKGHGTADHRYDLTFDNFETASALVSPRRGNFGVCSQGHFHDEGTVWQCPACIRYYCPDDGPWAELRSCNDCNQRSCRHCTEDPRPGIVRAECQVCDRKACPTSNHALDLRSCTLCLRAACDACCASSGICVTCQSLTLIPSGSPAIPSWLHHFDLPVLFAQDRTAQLFAVAGLVRQELVLAHNGETQWWATTAVDTVSDQVGRILAFNAGVGELNLNWAERSEEPPNESTRLSQAAQTRLHWRVTHPSGESLLTSPADGVPLDGEPVSTLLLTLTVPAARPSAMTERQAPLLLSAIGSNLASKVSEAHVDVSHTIDHLSFGAYGLEERRNGVAKRYDWATVPLPSWIPLDFCVANDTCLVATDGQTAVAITESAGMGLLFVRSPGKTPTTTRLWGDDSSLMAARLRSHFRLPPGRPRCIDMCQPFEVTLPVLQGAKLLQRSHRYRAVACSNSVESVPLDEVLVTVGIDCVAPTLSRIITSDLVRRFRTNPEPIPFNLEPTFCDTFEVGGLAKQVEYVVEFAQRKAFVLDHVSGSRLSSGVIDAFGHITAWASTCSYCERWLSSCCPDNTLNCVACNIAICTACVVDRSYPLCPACTGLKRSGLFTGGGLDSLGSIVLTGTDRVHQVRATSNHGVWTMAGNVVCEEARRYLDFMSRKP